MARTEEFTIGSGESNPDFTPIEELSYEKARAELVEVVRILELGQMSLDESLRYWERGEALARRCEDYLEGARARVNEVIAPDHDADDADDADSADGTAGTDDAEGSSEKCPF